MKNFWSFRGPGADSGSPAPAPEQSAVPTGTPEIRARQFIGQKYEVYSQLGAGGFGVVYLVYSHETHSVYALKTFRDEYLQDETVREQFRREARIWVEMGRHPYIVHAHFVDEIGDRLYIAMDYIAPDQSGLNSLAGYLRHQPPDLRQSLTWSIQFCHGMEHAYAKGLRCHRDIKPANILISDDRTLRIADFGLAGVLVFASRPQNVAIHVHEDSVGLSMQTVHGAAIGTPTHMPPEQFLDSSACDERSDIYAFGVVMYQMVSGGRPPFFALPPQKASPADSTQYWLKMFALHSEARVPKLDSHLFPIIERCLAKTASDRYQSFADLRKSLTHLLTSSFPTPRPGSIAHAVPMETFEIMCGPEPQQMTVSDWTNKGNSLATLRRFEEALLCFDAALHLARDHAYAWTGKGNVLRSLGQSADAEECYTRALSLRPEEPTLWANKGNFLLEIGRDDEAAKCFERALSIDSSCVPALLGKASSLSRRSQTKDALAILDRLIKVDPQNPVGWRWRADALFMLSRFDEALSSYELVLVQNPRSADAWNQKGVCLKRLSRIGEAIACYDRALQLQNHADFWRNKGLAYRDSEQYAEAIESFQAALDLEPTDEDTWNNVADLLNTCERFNEGLACCSKGIRLHPKSVGLWINKGNSLDGLGSLEEAIACFDTALGFDPTNTTALNNKGDTLNRLGRFQEALQALDRAVVLDPRDSMAWNNRGNSLNHLGRLEEAVQSYERAIQVDPNDARAWKNKGITLQMLGRQREADRCFAKVSEIQSRYPH
ncbi:MAG: tetratricopeptide repeat protein [Terriglobales bacterium]